jgi:GT2 family glycosyltransferase
MRISVLVATCDRAENLRQLLQTVGRWTISSDLDWELWVIDNNSKDSTREVAEYFAKQQPRRIRYLFEGARGKSRALNAGLERAGGDILVMTDDDCIPDPHWLSAIAEEFSRQPEIGLIGGRVELYDPADKAVTIRTSCERRGLSDPADFFSFIAGCNMAFRTQVYQAIGGFDIRLGPGCRCDAAEDVDFIYRAYKKGFRIEYIPEVLVYHNHGRRTDAEIQKLNRNYVIGRGAFYCKHILKGDMEVLRMAYWEVRSLSLSLLKDLFAGRTIREQMRLLWFLFTGVTRNLAA